MDQATQQNAALVEQSAAAAESLKGQAQQLVSAVAVFKLAGDAGTGNRVVASHLDAANQPMAVERARVGENRRAPLIRSKSPALLPQAGSGEAQWTTAS